MLVLQIKYFIKTAMNRCNMILKFPASSRPDDTVQGLEVLTDSIDGIVAAYFTSQV